MAAAPPHPPSWLAFDTEPPVDPTGVVLAGTAARTRAGLFDALAAALALPDYFGRNWDALADVLADRLDAGPLTLVVSDAAELLADEPPAQLGTLLDLLGGVATGGHEPLRLVLRERARRLPAVRRRIGAALAGVAAPPGPAAAPPLDRHPDGRDREPPR
ncbi:barstar family protein [Micromonospora eburnea]|uniref:Barstar (Barnase inhibitor) n=1 Tax=Micromonospora eburnea TaxID=227316 RepID=A0A1C6UKF8_9ACTN|nr:barstar family protein [Micromonospora eburnea]SCL54565.1 Barstar (barnase inhibitor) [Micromonospora eburnea]